ncbi:hypothetical protein [Methylopila sp. 73B]|uniref:hypothetical protein n=1 Tax=Methylopila sp. 73B TaxID=1120792 RepID=UPI00036BCB09|nr:hypothetical protein [Methylopila sp. 73B]
MSIADARREALELVQLQGLRIAIQAAIDIAGDKAAPAPARATASGQLMRAAAIGGFSRQNDGDLLEKEPHEMTGDELARAIAALKARRSAASDEDDDDEPSVFD